MISSMMNAYPLAAAVAAAVIGSVGGASLGVWLALRSLDKYMPCNNVGQEDDM